MTKEEILNLTPEQILDEAMKLADEQLEILKNNK